MTFNLIPTLIADDLQSLTAKLSKLANTVQFDQTTAELTIDNFSPQAQRAIEDLVMPHLPIVNEAPDWSRLAALKRKRELQEQAR